MPPVRLGYHARRRAADARRERALLRAGYHVLRLEADLVIRDVEGAIDKVRRQVERLRGKRALPIAT